MWKVLLLTVLLPAQYNQASVPQTPEQFQPSYDLAAEAIFAIGVRMQVFEDQDNADKNFIVSPLSTALTLGQLMIGADEQFRQDIYYLLSLPDNKTHQLHSVIGYYDRNNKVHINFNIPYASLHLEMANLLRQFEHPKDSELFRLTAANALFADSDLVLKQEFVHNLKLYKTDIKKLDFGQNPLESQRIINNWAAEQTNNLITTILPRPPSRSDAAIFANAVYFKADWKTPFSYELTYNGDFRVNMNKTISVEYMRGFIEEINYAESTKLGCKMIGLPYKGDQVTMYLILPNEINGTEYNIKQFAAKIKTKDIVELLNQSRKYDVNMQIPKMKLSSSLSILKQLQKFKVYKSLDKQEVDAATPEERLEKLIQQFRALNITEYPDVYLNNATENQGLKISNILQQVSLTVDEKGTEAAAVSASLVNYSGGNKNFKIDRPFLFFIRHEPTATDLFWGNIVNPIQTE